MSPTKKGVWAWLSNRVSGQVSVGCRSRRPNIRPHARVDNSQSVTFAAYLIIIAS